MVSLLGKPLGSLCTEMEGKQSDFRVGDVKYHLGEAATHLAAADHRHAAYMCACGNGNACTTGFIC